MKEGSLAADRIRPYHEPLQGSLHQLLLVMRHKADWTEWQAVPEVYQLDSQLHFMLPLTFNGQQQTFCFSFLIDGGQWYFQHMESIVIRLDQLGALPASTFPDIPEFRKAWIREELRITEQVRLFGLLVEEKGRSFAFNWFQDGAGYVLAAATWLPFVDTSRAFVLYACWEQANLRGNRVTLIRLADRDALIKLETIYFKLYRAAGPLTTQISWLDYRLLFESIWHDRATHAGWRLDITYVEEASILHFHKTAQAAKPGKLLPT
ncbi:MAG: hypothetical protein JXA89_04550 [Anaerolineae bacterium]|nr:hypothetical protein [Anaerolineae bacterium]